MASLLDRGFKRLHMLAKIPRKPAEVAVTRGETASFQSVPLKRKAVVADSLIESHSAQGNGGSTVQVQPVSRPAPREATFSESSAEPSLATADKAEGNTAQTSEVVPLEDAARSPARSTSVAKREARYGVQVGAFYRFRAAEGAAEKAARKLPDLLAGASIKVTPIEGRRGRIFRGRVVGLTKRDAQKACQQLRSLKLDCLVVKVGRSVKLTYHNRRAPAT